MNILVTLLNSDESFHLTSRTKLTSTKVYEVLIEEELLIMSYEEFLTDIWSLLLQGIHILKPSLRCALSPITT